MTTDKEQPTTFSLPLESLEQKLDLQKNVEPDETLEDNGEAVAVEKRLAHAALILALESPPVGWMTNSATAKEIGRQSSTIQRAAAQYKDTHPHLFQEFMSPKGVPRTFYAPELVEFLRNDLALEPLPEDWVTLTEATNLLNVDRGTVLRAALQYADSHPEWFGEKTLSNGHKTQAFSKDLVANLQEEFLSRQAPPQGWVTPNTVAKELGADPESIRKAVDRYRETYPEEIGVYAKKGFAPSQYISPVLVAVIAEERNQFPERPDGWANKTQLSKRLSRPKQTIGTAADKYRSEHPEWFQQFILRGKVSEYYSPELIEVLEIEFDNRLSVPDGWRNNASLSKELDKSESVVKRIADTYRTQHSEWFGMYENHKRQLIEHYSPELVEAIQTQLEEEYIKPLEGWVNASQLQKPTGRSYATIVKAADQFRSSHPEWFGSYTNVAGAIAEYYSPELTAEVIQLLDESMPPEGWLAPYAAAKQLSIGQRALASLLEDYRESYPEYFRKVEYRQQTIEYLHPDLIELLEKDVDPREMAPEGWLSNKALSKNLNRAQTTVTSFVEQFREEHPEWFMELEYQHGRVATYYAPELIRKVEENLGIFTPDTEIGVDTELEKLKQDLEDNLLRIQAEGSMQADEFGSLIALFGAERAIDILYQQHPEYQKLPVPYVKSALADYLGEFLLVKGGFSLDSLEKGISFLANTPFKDGLTEVIKNDCLRLLNELSRTSPDEVNEIAVAEYIKHIRQETAGFSSPDLEEVLGEIEAYYQLLFENIHKPDCFVDQLDNGRRFPDINQRINVQEIAFKHKILIADDMGMGKSASAIMAKEIIGAKQALIVVPSNVTSVWENYLSDRVGENGEQIGYFKEGQAPRILMVNSLEDLNDISHEDYDYIVISQERLNERYTDALSEFDYDMLIVDEMHKLKNISSGKRSENLIKLAEQIEGEDKYLALLSGTPVPNRIGDVALTLKLLYPERFGDVDNKKLVSQILNGDMLDLRSLLVPRMQMKSLTENIDMPELQEVTRTIELSDQEKEIYDILIEEDELSASEKLVTLRQFAMNPRMLDATPDIVGSKALEVGEALRSTFSQKDKIVMFVNGYIEGVMRGDDTIIQDLNLPHDVEVLTIDGSVSKERRIEIQNQLQSADRKMLLVVSGQTADTGVDFSAAEAVYHYNEPWSIYDKQQQTARVYRPGLKSDLVVETFVTEGTIERGIHEYIDSKYHAVEKLLRGVPVSEIEKRMLRQAEKQADPDIEVNPELAKYYFSSWDKMMKIYGHVKEVGEEDFRKFLSRYDKDYADSYADLAGSRSYQANVSRLSGSIIQEMIKEKERPEAAVRVLDMASGPEVLKRHAVEELAQSVISIDINRQHFNNAEGKKAVGSMVHLPIADKSIDYANLSLALHYTSFAPSKNNYERLEVLEEVNRVLTVGGRATISMIYSLSLDDNPAFEETMGKLGLKVIGEYTGEVSGGNNFQTQVITLEKVRDCSSDVRTLAKEIGPQGIKALKFRKTDTSCYLSALIQMRALWSFGKKMGNC